MWDRWHTSFHGTGHKDLAVARDMLQSILAHGALLRPGSKTMHGREIAVGGGHEQRREWAEAVFTSPSSLYSSHRVYAKEISVAPRLRAQVMLSLRQKPGSYEVEGATLPEWLQTDPFVHNDRIEWRTECEGGIILQGLLVKTRGIV